MKQMRSAVETSGADAAAYGILANLIEATLDTPLSHVARGYPRLEAYCVRMRVGV
ncbi:glutathione S-transferase C-terminal domain-containing protein [Klebsiella pneumoniae]|uniref:glutathione S-transferase C-terminal domain-containing protein n=1 Tax=Klebsiella pneumoniae TaxID=573 RepID=UPI0039695D6B